MFYKIFNILTGKRKRMKFLSFDIETVFNDERRKGQFLFGTIYNGQDYMTFKDRLKMKEFMISRPFAGCRFFAHNLEYDLNRVFLHDEKLERVYLGGRLMMAKYETGGKFIYFLDSFNYSFCSLKKIGEAMNLNKKDIKFSDKITEKYVDYNKQDCKIVYDFVEHFQNLVFELGGNLKATIGGIALDIYRRKYFRKEWEYFQIGEKFKPMFREGYFGGRVEVFNFNQFSSVNYYDINSSYPSSMLNKFPLLNSFERKPDILKEGITFCKISIPDKYYYPPLPFRNDTKLLFPVGNWSGYYYNNELRDMIDLFPNANVKILSGWHYRKSDYIFKNYVLEMYDRRQKAKTELEKFIFKTLLTSLYGKFASRNFLTIYKAGQKKIINSIPLSSNVIWSAYITAYSRGILNRLLLKSNSVYCDTDSSISVKKFSVTDKIGGIGLKGIYKNFKANNSKDYQYTEGLIFKRKIKGIPDKAVLNNDLYEYDTPVKYRTSLIRKLPLWAWIKNEKRLSGVYEKRIKLKNGDTEPVKIKDGKLWLQK